MIQRVIKFGGSLFDVPRIDQHWRTWLRRQEPAANVVVVGGGPLVDSIRSWQRELGINDAVCHWMSIDAMSLCARLVHQLTVDSEWTRNFADLKHRENGIVVFDAADWLRTRNDLPESWNVTSDSIAAKLAQSLNAHELVLLKSVLPPLEHVSIIEWAEAGFVDRYFPMAAAGLSKIRIVNLRSIHEEIELVAC